MKYLSFLALLCLLSFFSCEREDFSPAETSITSSSEKIDGSHYLTMVELANVIKGQGKNTGLITEEAVASVAAIEGIDLVLLGQQVLTEMQALRSQGLSDDVIVERMTEAHVSAMGIARAKLGTPCYDTYIDNIRTAYVGFGVCAGLAVAVGPAGLLGCSLGLLAGQANALIKYETCLDNNYPNGG